MSADRQPMRVIAVPERQRATRRAVLLGLPWVVILACAPPPVEQGHAVDPAADNAPGSTGPLIEIDVGADGLRRLEARRRQALRDGVLIRRKGDYVRGTVATDGGAAGPAKVRLKGDWVDHLEGKKWSMRVKVKGEHAALGMRVFSLQHPKTREGIGEWQFLEHLRAEDLLAPRYLFARVRLNGEDRGIFAVEEHFSKEMLENARRRESVIFKFDESFLWNRLTIAGPHAPMQLLPGDFRLERSQVFRKKKTARNPQLVRYRDASLALLQGFVDGTRQASEVFDVDELGRYLAICELWSAKHAIRWHNVRFYYDPLTTRVSPIGFDGNVNEPSTTLVVFAERWTRKALGDPPVAAAFIEHLERMAAADYVSTVEKRQVPELTRLHALLSSEWPGMPASMHHAMAEKASTVRRLLALPRLVRATAVETQEGLEVSLSNTAIVPVEVTGYRIGDDPQVHPLTAAESPESTGLRLDGLSGEPMRLRKVIPWTPGDERKLWLVARIVGRKATGDSLVQRLAAPSGTRDFPPPANLQEVLAKHTFLSELSPAALRVAPGKWQVQGDLILPNGMGLAIEAGTELSFAPGAVMVVSGPLAWKGAADSRIRLLPRAGPWAGLFVHDAPPSELQYVDFLGTAGIDRQGWRATGGVTFYRSTVKMLATRFLRSAAEDMLNVVRSNVDLDGAVFATAASDAFDGDWTTSRIRGSAFRDIRGDAIDVSGSELILSESQMTNIGDKGVSAGEESQVSIHRMRVKHANIAVASKDLSRVTVDEIDVEGVNLGFLAFQKKAEYGPAELKVTKATLTRVAQHAHALVGSSCWLNGVDTPRFSELPRAAQATEATPATPTPPANPATAATAANPANAANRP